MGPKAYPNTYSEVESVDTVTPTSKCSATACVEAEKTEEVKVEQRQVYARMTLMWSLISDQPWY
jgi:hypothetical protein